nr:acyl-ACP thioesterase domain-containing protein [uncultured Allomuricauda sp.]
MQHYKETFKVVKEDLDDLNHVNNIRYIEWILEISKNHWLEVVDEAIRNEIVWVVKSHNINYSKPAKLNDPIEVTTYIKNTKGPLSIRVVEVRNNKTGQLLVNASTEWCLLDAKTFRPKRVPESIQNLFIKV